MNNFTYEFRQDLYRASLKNTSFDIQYYINFCKGYKTLELFAGFGRITNQLVSKGVDVYAVEIDPLFSKDINIPNTKLLVENVCHFNFKNVKFDRIFAAYDSFCLLTSKQDIISFFENVSNHLSHAGKLSLSYFSPKTCSINSSKPFIFNYNSQLIAFNTHYVETYKANTLAVSEDIYRFSDGRIKKYQIHEKIYNSDCEIIALAKHFNMELFDIVENYNNKSIIEDGWKEYIFTKA